MWYFAGVDTPRRAKGGKELKSSRYISAMIFPALSFPDKELTNFFMQMTQVIAHDITLQINDNNLSKKLHQEISYANQPHF